MFFAFSEINKQVTIFGDILVTGSTSPCLGNKGDNTLWGDSYEELNSVCMRTMSGLEL